MNLEEYKGNGQVPEQIGIRALDRQAQTWALQQPGRGMETGGTGGWGLNTYTGSSEKPLKWRDRGETQHKPLNP